MENNFFWLSKNRNLTDKEYIFGKTKEFLKIVNECFEVSELNDESIKIKLENGRAVIYYATEFDKSKDELEGHILLDVFAVIPWTSSLINKAFEKFVLETNAYLFLVVDNEEKLVIGYEGLSRIEKNNTC